MLKKRSLNFKEVNETSMDQTALKKLKSIENNAMDFSSQDFSEDESNITDNYSEICEESQISKKSIDKINEVEEPRKKSI